LTGRLIGISGKELPHKPSCCITPDDKFYTLRLTDFEGRKEVATTVLKRGGDYCSLTGDHIDFKTKKFKIDEEANEFLNTFVKKGDFMGYNPIVYFGEMCCYDFKLTELSQGETKVLTDD